MDATTTKTTEEVKPLTTEQARKLSKLREQALYAVEKFYDALNFNQLGTADDRQAVLEAFRCLSRVNGGVWFEATKGQEADA
jgi:hypothetical protein